MGQTEVITGVDANQSVTITEGKNITARMPFKK
jgi:hypothetical protein